MRLLEDADRLLRLSFYLSVSSRCGSLLLSLSTEVHATDDVITFEGSEERDPHHQTVRVKSTRVLNDTVLRDGWTTKPHHSPISPLSGGSLVRSLSRSLALSLSRSLLSADVRCANDVIASRDLFYTDVKLFEKQNDSDNVLDDVACLVGQCTAQYRSTCQPTSADAIRSPTFSAPRFDMCLPNVRIMYTVCMFYVYML